MLNMEKNRKSSSEYFTDYRRFKLNSRVSFFDKPKYNFINTPESDYILLTELRKNSCVIHLVVDKRITIIEN